MSRGKYKNKKNKRNSVSKGIAAAAAFATLGLTGLTEASNVKLVGLNNAGKTEGEVSGKSDNWSQDSMGLRGTNVRWSSVDEDFDKTESPDSVLNVEKVGQASKNKYQKSSVRPPVEDEYRQNLNSVRLPAIDKSKVGTLPILDLKEILDSNKREEQRAETRKQMRKQSFIKAMEKKGVYGVANIYDKLHNMPVEYLIAAAPPELLDVSVINKLLLKPGAKTLEDAMGSKELDDWLISLDENRSMYMGLIMVKKVHAITSNITSDIEKSKRAMQDIMNRDGGSRFPIKDAINKAVLGVASSSGYNLQEAVTKVVGEMLAVRGIRSFGADDMALEAGIGFVLNASLLNSLCSHNMDELLRALPQNRNESEVEYLEREIAFLQGIIDKASFLSNMMRIKAEDLADNLKDADSFLSYNSNNKNPILVINGDYKNPIPVIADFMAVGCAEFQEACLAEINSAKEALNVAKKDPKSNG